MSMERRLLLGIVALAAMMIMVSCGGPEQKKAKFYNRGRTLYEKGDYTKARLEFRNAIQIDVKYADAYYMLGMTSLKSGDPGSAYGSIRKAVDLNPKLWDAQVQMGWFLLGGGKMDEAMEKVELVLKNKPGDEDALILKGAVLIKKKDVEAARKHFETVLGREVHKPDGYLMLASLHGQNKDAAGIERVLLDGIKDNPKAVPIHLALVDLYAKTKRTDDAIRQMQKVIELEPENDQHRLAMVAIEWQAGREQEAKDALKAFVQADPKKEDRWVLAARFYDARRRPADVEAQLKEGIQQNPKSYTIRFALSSFYFASNKPEQGLALLQECLGLERDAANPNVLKTKVTLAEYYLSRSDLDKAKQYADEVIKESPKNVDANFIAGTLYLRNQDAQKAVSAFRTVVNERQQFIPGYIYLADAHRMNKEPKLASDTLQNALKIAPDSRDVQLSMARLAASQKDLKGAEAQYRKLLNVNSEDLEVYADLGDVLVAAGDLRRAENAYLEIRKLAPKHPLSYVKMSALYGSQKKWDKAISELEQAVRYNPEAWPITNDLAYLLITRGRGKQDLERAERLAEKAKTLNPDSPVVDDTLGWVRYQRGDVKQAVELLTKAQARNEKNPVVNYHLGMAFNGAGSPDRAKQYLQLALASKAEFPERADAEKTLAAIR